MTSNTNSFVYVGLGTEGGQEGHGLYRRPVGEGAWEMTTKGMSRNPEVRTIAITPNNPSILYAGTQDGLYRSDNCGDSWERLDLPGDPVPIWSVTFHPNNPHIIYAGGEETKLYVSQDGGHSWELIPINTTFPSVTTTPRLLPKRVIGLALDPQRPEEMYAAIEVGGLLRSTDGGSTWESVSEGHYQNDDPVDLHSVHVSSHRPGRVSIISRIGLFRSDDGGDHWSWGRIQRLSPNGTYCRVIREAPNDPSTLYVGAGPEFRGDPGALFRSRDYGETWQKVDVGIPLNSTLFGFAINPRDPDQMYCATRHGQVVGTHNGGQSWQDYSLPQGAQEVNALAVG